MTLVLLSGGLDSTVLLAHYAINQAGVEAISFDYGQRHVVELDAARDVARYYGVPHHVLNLTGLAAYLPSALTGHSPVPFGEYTPDTMSATVVPNRNAVLLSVAAGVASSRSISTVATAVHAGDHEVYQDCRPEFIEAMSRATQLGCGVTIEAPFSMYSKREIVVRGRELQVPFHRTWSCYLGGERPCGACSTCLEREAALA